MKLLTTVSLGLVAFGAGSLMAEVPTLQGQTYEGTFSARPLGAATMMEFKHMLEFGADWTVVDNAPTWHGREPVKCQYGMEMKGKDKDTLNSVVVTCNGLSRIFKVVESDNGALQLKGEHAMLGAKATVETPADL